MWAVLMARAQWGGSQTLSNEYRVSIGEDENGLELGCSGRDEHYGTGP